MARKLPTLVVPQAANVPVNDIPAPEWLGVKQETSVMAELRFDPEHPSYGAVRGTGVSSAQRTANTEAINLAASDATAAGGTLVIKGEYEIDGTVQVQSHMDAQSGRLDYYGTGTAILVGSKEPGSKLDNKVLMLPYIENKTRTGSGSGVFVGASDVGVDVCNVDQSQIYTGTIRRFNTNLLMSANAGGCCYNTVHMGHLMMGRVNLELAREDNGGWVNENVFIGGRWYGWPSDGTNVPGFRNILLSSYDDNGGPNNNVFLKPSIEGDVPEYHIEINGSYNTFMQARWESSPPKVYFGPFSTDNVFFYGYGNLNIQYFFAPTGNPGARTHVFDRHGHRIDGNGYSGGVQVRNSSGDWHPGLQIMSVVDSLMEADPETDWAGRYSAAGIKLKRNTDAHPRFQINTLNREILMGGGDAPPTRVMRTTGGANNLTFDEPVWARGGISLYPDSRPQGPQLLAGDGDPEGVVAAAMGSMFLSTNGNWYRKATGSTYSNTGWVAM